MREATIKCVSFNIDVSLFLPPLSFHCLWKSMEILTPWMRMKRGEKKAGVTALDVITSLARVTANILQQVTEHL